MLNFIDVIVFDNSDPSGKPSKTSLSFSNKILSDETYLNRLCIVGTLPHNSTISFDKENAQKLIGFLEKIS